MRISRTYKAVRPKLEVRAETFHSCIADIASVNEGERTYFRLNGQGMSRMSTSGNLVHRAHWSVIQPLRMASSALSLSCGIHDDIFLGGDCQRQRSSTGKGSGFVIDIWGGCIEESNCPAASCTATFWFGY